MLIIQYKNFTVNIKTLSRIKDEGIFMLNYFWIGMMIIGFVTAAFTGKIDETVNAMFESCSGAVQLCIGLLGVMCFWCGIVKIAEKSGLTEKFAKLARPFIKFLFPRASKSDRALSAIVMNFAADILGLGNAATPLGIKACQEIKNVEVQEKGLSYRKEASDEICMFLIINMACIQLIPATVIAMRAAAKSSNPSSILAPTWIVSIISFVLSIVLAKLFAGFKRRFNKKVKI